MDLNDWTMLEMAVNFRNWLNQLEIAGNDWNGQKWLEMTGIAENFLEFAGNGWKQLIMAGNGWNDWCTINGLMEWLDMSFSSNSSHVQPFQAIYSHSSHLQPFTAIPAIYSWFIHFQPFPEFGADQQKKKTLSKGHIFKKIFELILTSFIFPETQMLLNLFASRRVEHK